VAETTAVVGGGSGSPDNTDGPLDHLFGSADEAVARQFDDTEGGGLLDPAGEPGDGRSEDPSERDDIADVAGESIRTSLATLASPLNAGVGGTAIDAAFQRPEELPTQGDRDTVDLPGGSPSNPTGDPDFQGEDRTADIEWPEPPDWLQGDGPDLTPDWLDWTLDNQELVLLGLVAIVVLFATDGSLAEQVDGGA
jgi:hypothetical protein